MEFKILGPLEVVDEGRRVAVSGHKERAVLAVLLLRANELVDADRIIEEVWSGEPPASSRKSLQVRIANLRKALGPNASKLITKAPGYVLRLGPDELDLHRFERLVASSDGADPGAAAAALGAALALWRGAPLADLAHERFAPGPIARLEELRVAALEKRIDADLALGRHAELVPELEGLVADHPFRERLRAQLMLGLYRCGRQADALGVYRDARRVLADELGLEPGPSLQRLERAILEQSPSLEPAHGEGVAATSSGAGGPIRAILVGSVADLPSETLLTRVAEPIARRSRRELILMSLVTGSPGLRDTTASVLDIRDRFVGRGLSARAAAFTSAEPGNDLVRAVAEQDVDLLLLDAPPALIDDPLAESVLVGAACDVAVLVGPDRASAADVVLVPFGGSDHDWAAVELAARIAEPGGRILLAGIGDGAVGERDASRLLASVSIAMQRALDVAAEPVLVARDAQELVRVAGDAGLVVVGLSERWQTAGLGDVRGTLASESPSPVLLVRRGLRPGVLAPPESATRFTWTLRAG